MQRGPATLTGSRGQQSSRARPAPRAGRAPLRAYYACLSSSGCGACCLVQQHSHDDTMACLPVPGATQTRGTVHRDPVRSQGGGSMLQPADSRLKLNVLTAYAF
jgi:hypothetical protein